MSEYNLQRAEVDITEEDVRKRVLHAWPRSAESMDTA